MHCTSVMVDFSLVDFIMIYHSLSVPLNLFYALFNEKKCDLHLCIHHHNFIWKCIALFIEYLPLENNLHWCI